MKTLARGQVWFALLFVALFAVLIVTATGYNPAARTMPLIVAIPALLGAVANLIADFRAAQSGKPAKEKRGHGASEAAVVESSSPVDLKTGAVDVESAKKKIKKEKISPEQKRKRELIGMAWLFGYAVALVLFGFNLATIGYLVAFIKFYGHESWKLTIVYTAVLWIFVYVAFVVFLKSTLPPGLVFGWLGL